MAINQDKLWTVFRWAGDGPSFGLAIEGDKVGVHGLIAPQTFDAWGRELGRATHLGHGVEDLARERGITKGELMLMNVLMLLQYAHDTAPECDNLRQPVLGLIDAVSYLFDKKISFKCGCETAPAEPKQQSNTKFIEIRSREELIGLLRKLHVIPDSSEDAPTDGTLN